MKKKVALIIVFGAFLLIQPISAQTWEATKRLTWTSGGSFSQAIAVASSSNIHIVWTDYNPGNLEIVILHTLSHNISIILII